MQEITSDRLDASWGEAISKLPPADREELIARLAARRAVFVRVSLTLGRRLSSQPFAARVVLPKEESRPLLSEKVYGAPAVDSRIQGQTFLVRIDEPGPSLRPGAAVTAYLLLPDAPRQGVMIPRPAVIRFSGRTWVYVKLDTERFTRREIALARATDKGWFTTEGVTPKDTVVVAGAEILLSEELKSQIQIGD